MLVSKTIGNVLKELPRRIDGRNGLKHRPLNAKQGGQVRIEHSQLKSFSVCKRSSHVSDSSNDLAADLDTIAKAKGLIQCPDCLPRGNDPNTEKLLVLVKQTTCLLRQLNHS